MVIERSNTRPNTRQFYKISPSSAKIPDYLNEAYWWAYVHPNAIRLFERGWLVNLILWGWYKKLRDAALNALGKNLTGRTLQVACCYGDLIPMLAHKVWQSSGALDVIDIVEAQLYNLGQKLEASREENAWQQYATLSRMDSSDLLAPSDSYDRVLLFFLLHEQPEEVRIKTIAEALRVLRINGKMVIVDFSRPELWHPLRIIWLPVLRLLEPFAKDLWRFPLTKWLPDMGNNTDDKAGGTVPKWHCVELRKFFGGMYQMMVLVKTES